jgi:hypothetical protein
MHQEASSCHTLREENMVDVLENVVLGKVIGDKKE